MELYQQGAAVSVFTYAVMMFLKKRIAKRFLPAISIIVACFIAGSMSYALGIDWKQTVIAGLAGGASSMGFHDTVRSINRKDKNL